MNAKTINIISRAKCIGKSILYTFAPQLCLRLRATKYRRDGFEEELSLVPLLANTDEMAIDVGGNHGFYASFMRRYCSELIVIEPNPALAVELRRGLGREVRVMECALSDTTGCAVMRLPLAEGQDLSGLATIETSNPLLADVDSQQLNVEAKTLDSLLLKGVGFIKIDVEGHELAALKGARTTLESFHPSLLIEAEDRHRPRAVRSVVDFLAPMGYKGFYFTGKRLHSIDSFDAKRHQKVANVGNPGGLNKYINNFIFVSRPDKFERLQQLMA
ncbi:MAG: FkbM family methyltransferase [Panacagrimonas sp.]